MGRAIGTTLVLALLATACFDSQEAAGAGDAVEAAGGDAGDEAAPDLAPGDALPDTIPEAFPEVAAESHAPWTLRFVDPTDDVGASTAGATTFTLHVGYAPGTRDLKVQLVEGTTTVGNVGLKWEMLNATVGTCQLATQLVYTDADGEAVGKLSLLQQKVEQFQVRVSVDGDASVAPSVFDVQVGPFDGAPLTVGFTAYAGGWATLDNVEVRLFKQVAGGQPACAGLAFEQVSKMVAVVASPSVAIDGTYPFFTLPDLEQDQHQTYTIIALARAGSGATKAWACNDTDGKVTWGGTTYVELTLKDRRPRLGGSYDVISTFDFATGLPADVAANLHTVQDLLGDPGETLLLLACKVGGATGPLHDLCVVAFQDPANPDPAHLTPTGETLAAMLGPTPVPQVPWADVLAVDLLGTLTFLQEPDAAGAVPPAATQEVVHSVRLHWGAAAQSYSFSQIPGIDSASSGHFAATLTAALPWPTAGLEIAVHPLDLKYGALLGFATEVWALVRTYGDGSDGLPAVDRYGPFIGSLMAGKACLQTSDCSSPGGTCQDCCAAWAANVALQVFDLTQDQVAAACTALVQQVPPFLRAPFTALDAATNSFAIGTQAPCAVTDANDDLDYDTLGTPGLPCAWDATWTWGSATFKPAATFTGMAK